MAKLKLSRSILEKIPPHKRKKSLKNLQWAARNLMLSNAERAEVNQYLEKMRKDAKGV